MAFQIKDDLFDYSEEKIGKPTGIDIKEQKMTLPLIYTLNSVDIKLKKYIINIVKNHNKGYGKGGHHNSTIVIRAKAKPEVLKDLKATAKIILRRTTRAKAKKASLVER